MWRRRRKRRWRSATPPICSWLPVAKATKAAKLEIAAAARTAAALGTAAPAKASATALFLRGLSAALHDIDSGRAELRAAAALPSAATDPRSADVHSPLLAAAALTLCCGIADDDYSGFEAAVHIVLAGQEQVAHIADPAHRLLLQAAALTARRFAALDDPGLAALALPLLQGLNERDIAAPLRCWAGLELMAFHRARFDLPSVLVVELALRPLRADARIGARLADEVHHLLVQALYECEAPERAAAVRAERLAAAAPLRPAIALKLLLLDAQIALGSGQVALGEAALAQAEPLLAPSAPRPAAWWHLLRSRLDMLQGRLRQALTHARVALQLGSASGLPERWMGVTVMQEGQVLMASGEPGAALPFFERAARGASGTQAGFCLALAHMARALQHFAEDAPALGRSELERGLALARELSWLNFFRACPPVAAAICSAALEHGLELRFVHQVIASRGLQTARSDVAAWPWPIRVRTLGGLHIEVDGQALVFKGKVARKPLELLLFIIACGGSDVSANTVVFGLWPELDGDKARAAFNAALHRLRRLLGQHDAVLLDHARLSLDAQRVWVDCLAFEEQADRVGSPAVGAVAGVAAVAGTAAGGVVDLAQRLAAARAQALYRGAFLHETDDATWQTTYRARLAAKFKRVVRFAAHDALQRGEAVAARAALLHGLEHDPQAEDLARELMQLLAASGEQASALQVFARCRDAIEHSLGVPPSAATVALAAQIRAQHIG